MKNISVILPVYNTEKYLRRCVDSIIVQENVELEIILVDDGSTDHSPTICDEYARRFSFIKALHIQNSGPATAKNMGLEIAQGEYVALLDSDDRIEPQMMSIMLQAAHQHKADIVCCNYKQIDEQGNPSHTECTHETEVLSHEQGLIHLLTKNRIYTQSWTKIFRRQIIEENQIRHDDGLKTDEDFLFNIRCFTKSQCCVVVDECLYEYTHRQLSLAHNYFQTHIDEYINNRLFRAKTIDTIMQAEASNLAEYGILHNLMYYNELLGKVSRFPQHWNDERIRQIKNYTWKHKKVLRKYHHLCGYSSFGVWLILLLPLSIYMKYRNIRKN